MKANASMGKLFREVREGNCMSVQEVAELAHVPVAYIVGLELGWTGVMAGLV